MDEIYEFSVWVSEPRNYKFVTMLKWDYLTAYIVKILITPRKIFKKFLLSFFLK